MCARAVLTLLSLCMCFVSVCVLFKCTYVLCLCVSFVHVSCACVCVVFVYLMCCVTLMCVCVIVLFANVLCLCLCHLAPGLADAEASGQHTLSRRGSVKTLRVPPHNLIFNHIPVFHLGKPLFEKWSVHCPKLSL